MATKQNHKLIRVPNAIAERIERIQEELLQAYEAGQTSRVELTDQGERGAWISKAEVIRLALDEMESHKLRSRASSRKRQTTPITN